jgi:putative peptidoglycan lipid II flippase
VLLAVPLLSTLFQYGAFAASDVLRTREALVAYSIGLTGLILVKVLAPGFLCPSGHPYAGQGSRWSPWP